MAERDWNPPWLIELFLRYGRGGLPRYTLMLLADGDKTLPEIAEGFARFWHHFGYFGREETMAGYTEETFLAALQEAVKTLEREDLIVLRGEVYSLTSEGRQRAQGMQRGMRFWRRWARHLLHPETVSLVGLGTHIVLAVLKLFAGSISGSLGLISDGLDTAMDGLSSVLVFVGLRLNKERYVNVVLVLLMLGVGAAAGYEAVRRVFIPEEVGVDLLTFGAAILSGLVCLLLSLYQRYVATQSKQLALISQAVDSRNHAIVAVGVTVGLAAALLRFPLLDTLVGLAIAALILKSGVELALETVRVLRGEQVDYSRYELGFVADYRRFQRRQLADWVLSVIVQEGPLRRAALLTRCREVFDVQDVPVLRELGMGRGAGWERRVAGALDLLVERGLISTGDELQATERGRAEMSPGVWGAEQVEAYAQMMERDARWVYAPLARRITESLPGLPENPLIVDLGVGPCFLSVELGRLLPEAAFICVNPSPQAAEMAQRIAKRAGLERFEVRQGRAEHLPVDSAVADLIASRAALHEWQDAPAALAQAYRVLKPGGFVTLQDLNKACPSWKRRLLALRIAAGSGLEMAQERMRSFETALTLEEVEELLTRTGFEVVKGEAGVFLFVVARKR